MRLQRGTDGTSRLLSAGGDMGGIPADQSASHRQAPPGRLRRGFSQIPSCAQFTGRRNRRRGATDTGCAGDFALYSPSCRPGWIGPTHRLQRPYPRPMRPAAESRTGEGAPRDARALEGWVGSSAQDTHRYDGAHPERCLPRGRRIHRLGY